MLLEELIPELKKYSKIVVSGSQRSGTTIATKILSQKLGLECLLEEEFEINSLFKFIDIFNKKNNFILQAPTMSNILHFLDERDIAVVFMLRNSEDVYNSINRIGWEYEEFECYKYFRTPTNIYDLKKECWDNYQKDKINSFELEYESLKNSNLWIDKEKRINFTPRQTEV